MLGMSVSSHTSISFGTGGDLHVMYMSQKNKVIFYMHMTRIFSDEFIISDMANDYTKYIAILSVILQIVKIFI